MRCLEGHFLTAREPGKRDGDWHTTLRKLRHDAEMFTWLAEDGKVSQVKGSNTCIIAGDPFHQEDLAFVQSWVGGWVKQILQRN